MSDQFVLPACKICKAQFEPKDFTQFRMVDDTLACVKHPGVSKWFADEAKKRGVDTKDLYVIRADAPA